MGHIPHRMIRSDRGAIRPYSPPTIESIKPERPALWPVVLGIIVIIGTVAWRVVWGMR